MDALIDQLKSSPRPQDVRTVLTEIHSEFSLQIWHPSVHSLRLFSTLVNSTVPELYDELDDATIDTLVDTLLCVPGLSSLSARISTLCESLAAENLQLPQILAICNHLNLASKVLGRVLRWGSKSSRVIQTVIDRTDTTNAAEARQLTSIFTGSRILDALAMAHHWLTRYKSQAPSHGVTWFEEWDSLSTPEAYCRVMAEEVCLLDLSTSSRVTSHLFERLVKLDSALAATRTLLTSERFTQFLSLFKLLRPLQQWYCLESRVLPSLQSTYLSSYQFGHDTDKSREAVSLISEVITRFMAYAPSDSSAWPLFKYGESPRVSFHMRRSLVLASLSRPEIFEPQFSELLSRWGNVLGISHTPIVVQEAQTQLLTLALKHLSKQQASEVTSSSAFLEGISNRLSAAQDKARLFGIVFGEQASIQSGDSKPLNFGIEVMKDEQESWKSNVASVKDKKWGSSDIWKELEKHKSLSLALGDALDSIEVGKISEHKTRQESTHTHSGNPRPLRQPVVQPDGPRITEVNSDDDSDDSKLEAYPFPDYDEEDSDDDPTLVNREKVAPPVYIKDLLTYLTADDNYDKNFLALSRAPALIRRKAQFGDEVKFYAKPLVENLIGIKDSFEMERFNEMRLQGLVALVASAPAEAVPHLSLLLFTADYSLQQRLSVLSALALGARELSGLQPETDPELLPKAKLLPAEVHKLFASPEDRLIGSGSDSFDLATRELQQGFLQESAEKANEELSDQISGPKVLRVSQKLVRQRQSDQNGGSRKIISNGYAKLAATTFFYPLVGQWYTAGGLKGVGVYSELVAAHFVKTLALLLHAAYPMSNDIPGMTGEYLDILLGQKLARDNAPVIEAVLTGILVVLDVNDAEFLVTRWPRQVVEIQGWLEETWKELPDERLQQMAAGVLYRVTAIAQTWERRLVGEFSGLEH